MTVKDSLLAALAAAKGQAVSGQALAGRLGVSRAAVWKAAEALQAQGYAVQAVPGKGYTLAPGGSRLYAEGVRAFLARPGVQVQAFDTVDSTNRAAKALGAAGAPAGSLAVADSQTAGRGRRGRSFASPPGTGLYLSVVLRPACTMEQAAQVTCAAAVAVCQAVEALGGPPLAIKWVNDLFNADGRKCCGILTEAAADLESGGLDYLVVGMGLNLQVPAGGFGPDLADIAGAVFPAGRAVDRCRLAAEIANRLCDWADRLPRTDFMDQYRARNLVPGRQIFILQNGTRRPARALAITDEGHLLVETEEGREELAYGEVSVRFA